MSRVNPQHLERGWKLFERKVLSTTAPAVQRMHMRDGFYAGALVAFTTLTREVSADDDITPADMWLMADLDAELTAFYDELAQRLIREREES